MNESLYRQEKEVLRKRLADEKKILVKLEGYYKEALEEIENHIAKLLGRQDANLPNVINRVEYQRMIKDQVQAALERLHSHEYESIEAYLQDSYTDAFVGTMYSLHAQEVPIIVPIDQNAVIKAITIDTKLKDTLYQSLGKDMASLKNTIASEITRGIATGMLYSDMQRNLANATKMPLSRARLIVRTEAGRVQEEATMEAAEKAKAKGADVVKQWSSILDGKTRYNHRLLDHQVREVDEYFEVSGKKARQPHGFGDPAEDCNCRCTLLIRARAALDADELEIMKERASFHGLTVKDSKAFGKAKAKDFSDFKKKYLKASEALKNQGENGIIKLGNSEVRKWYLDSVSRIPDSIDSSLPMLEKAKKAFEARNIIRTEARNMMADEKTRKLLEQERPNKTFEELIKSKMERKGMTREEAIEDIYKTATKTNANVNKELGLEE